jgi:23S rRNA (adenine2503-C2)-methyltransferase
MPAPVPLALQALLPEELCDLAIGVTIAEARKIVSAVHRGGARAIRASAHISRRAVALVRDCCAIPTLGLVARTPSSVDPFVKYTLRTPDGEIVEAVRVPLEKAGRFTACISSQVGCALGCAFCATGRMGLRRNLDAWEIVEQVRVIRADLPAGSRVHGVVFQGMGEPLANWQAVLGAARIFSEASAQAIDARNITISTVGLPAGIRAMAKELPNVRLGVSVGSVRSPDVRKRLIPVDAVYPLAEVIAAAGDHARATKHSPLWAYTLLAGVNDSEDDARALALLALDFAARYGARPRISVIPYNAIGENDPFVRSDPKTEQRFQDVLVQNGVKPTKRYSGGSDVGAACGQLASAAHDGGGVVC